MNVRAERRMRIAVLVSGSGSNLQAMIDARTRGELTGTLALVLSNRPGVRALERAASAGIPAVVLDHKAFASREAFDLALHDTLKQHGIELVVLAGFMRLLGATFVGWWQGRLVNIHPSLLPAFPGAHAIRDACEARASRTGVTIHFVDAGTDTGPIIAQQGLDIGPDEPIASVETRIHAIEHQLYPQVVDLLARGEVRWDQGRVLRPDSLPQG